MHRIPTTDLGFARERTFNGTFHDINGIKCRRPLQTRPSAMWPKFWLFLGGCIGDLNYPKAWGLVGLGANEGIPNLIQNFHAFPSTSLCHSHRPRLF
jgi:hypothetical protein